MEKIDNKLIFMGKVALVAIAATIPFMGKAGTLTAPAAPAATGYTLTDIYNRLTTNVTSTSANHPFSPSAQLAPTLRTLTEIYGVIPTIDPSKVLLGTAYLGIAGTFDVSNLLPVNVKNGIAFGTSTAFGDYPSSANPLAGDTASADASVSQICSGKEAWTKAGNLLTGIMTINPAKVLQGYSYCGISGTYTNYSFGDNDASFVTQGATSPGTALKDLFNGSCINPSYCPTGTEYPGGTQANGGVIDFNGGGVAAPGRYEKSWTACSGGNNFCGVGNAAADAKDNSTGLIWSRPCSGVSCIQFADSATPTEYGWQSFSGSNNGGLSASQLCTSGSHGQTGWYLPHQKQLIQAVIDGSYGNLEAIGFSFGYWSATSSSVSTTSAYMVNLSGFNIAKVLKTNVGTVRCVRPNP